MRTLGRPNVHAFDLMPPVTSGDPNDACNVLVNIYARTRLQLNLTAVLRNRLTFQITPELLAGRVSKVNAYGRLFSPRIDMPKLFAAGFDARITRGASLRRSRALKFDSGKIMAKLEAEDHERFRLDDNVLAFRVTRNGTGKASIQNPTVPGVHHVGVLIEGVYHPEASDAMDGHVDQGNTPPM